MLYELTDTSKAACLFEDWQETLIYSCLQKVMGKVFVTDLNCPKSAMAYEFDHEYTAYEVSGEARTH